MLFTNVSQRRKRRKRNRPISSGNAGHATTYGQPVVQYWHCDQPLWKQSHRYQQSQQIRRTHSLSSEVELTRNKAELGGIKKAVGWETSNNGQQKMWSNVSEQESCSHSEFQPANVVSARSSGGH